MRNLNEMSDEQQAGTPQGNGDQRLVVWGERREEPDWDAFLGALIAFALRDVDRSADNSEEADA